MVFISFVEFYSEIQSFVVIISQESGIATLVANNDFFSPKGVN